MANDEILTTTVVFRKWKGKSGGDIIALFPELNNATGEANYGMVMSYMHIGQHGEADPHLVRNGTVPAKPEEYADLLAELKSLGYDPVVRKKIDYFRHLDRAHAAAKAAKENEPKPDVEVADQGTIVMITPMTEAAREWIAQNVQSEPWQWMGLSLCVDHRLAENLIEGMKGDGLTVK